MFVIQMQSSRSFEKCYVVFTSHVFNSGIPFERKYQRSSFEASVFQTEDDCETAVNEYIEEMKDNEHGNRTNFEARIRAAEFIPVEMVSRDKIYGE